MADCSIHELQRHQVLSRRWCSIVYVARSACEWLTIADAVGSCCQWLSAGLLPATPVYRLLAIAVRCRLFKTRARKQKVGQFAYRIACLPDEASPTARLSLLYALRVLRVHGIPDESLQEVFRATLLAKITYAGPAWHGMCTAGDISKLESLVKRCRRLGYCGLDEPTLSEMFSDADERLRNRVVNNSEHVLQPFLTLWGPVA